MNPSAWKSRRLVPRWRSLNATIRAKELAGPPASPDVRGAAIYPVELLVGLEKWRLRPGLITAAELVEAAIVSGKEKEAVDAARRIVAMDKHAAPLIREQAAALLIRNGHKADVPPELARAGAHGRIAIRSSTQLHPRDPLGWVELALHQTIRGHIPAAKRSMSVALGLAPHNRHVLRSAARLFLHDGDPEKAHDLIARNDATKTDPWLLASEIALAELAQRWSRLHKHSQRILDHGGFVPRQLTELAGAIATEELLSGNRKKSKKAFAISMIDPTGSALAQAEWATPEVGAEFVPLARFHSAPEPSEAVAMHHYRSRNFRYVPSACEGWVTADPFSIRPFEFASATTGMIEAYSTSLEFAERGLQIRPNAPTLLNAAAFALASMGRTERAEEFIRRVSSAPEDDPLPSLTMANRGLIAFRKGDIPLGLRFYHLAIEGFRREGIYHLSARARIFLAREAVIAGIEDAGKLVEEANKANEKYKETESGLMLRSLNAWVSAHSKDAIASSLDRDKGTERGPALPSDRNQRQFMFRPEASDESKSQNGQKKSNELTRRA